jgi:hypothetical protein
VLDDARQVGERLDVVDDRGLAEEALDSGERGLDAGPPALALDGLEQAGLFAADVRARAAVHVAVDLERAAVGGGRSVEQAIAAEDAVRVRLLDGILDDAGLVVVLTADEDVGGLDPARVAGDGDALEHEVRIEVDAAAGP